MILVVIVVYAQLRFVFRDMAALKFAEPPDVQVYKHIFLCNRLFQRVKKRKKKKLLNLSFQEFGKGPRQVCRVIVKMKI